MRPQSDGPGEWGAEVCAAAADFLSSLATLCQRCQLYGRNHPRTQECWDAFDRDRSELKGLLPPDMNEIIILERGNRLQLEGSPLPHSEQEHRVLIEHIQRKGMSGFLLSLKMSMGAMGQVLDCITRRKQDGWGGREPEGFRWLSTEDVDRFQGTLLDHEEAEKETPHDNVHLLLALDELKVDDQLYGEALSVLSEFFGFVTHGRPENLAALNSITRQLVDAVLNRPLEILPRTTIPYYNDFHLHHSLNVCLLVTRSASLVIRDQETLEHIAQACLLHDVGQAFLPEEILCKRKPLTPADKELILEHPIHGAEALLGIEGIHQAAISAAFGHHTKGEKAGYPKALTDYRAGPLTQLIEITDIFAALTSYRPHKRSVTAPQAFSYLYSEVTLKSMRRFVDLLTQAIGFHPCGSRVLTQRVQPAIVCDHLDHDPCRPMIRILEVTPEGQWSLGEKLDAVCRDVPWIVPPQSARTVIRALDPMEDLELMGKPSAAAVESHAGPQGAEEKYV